MVQYWCYKTGGSTRGWVDGDVQSVAVVTGKDAHCPSGSSRVRGLLDGLDGDLNQKTKSSRRIHLPVPGYLVP
jgi:hypothetical protein